MKKALLIVAVILIFLMLSINVAAADTETKINSVLEGAAVYDGNYYLMIKGNYTWEQAKVYCEGLGGHLVTITSKGEDDFCYQLYKLSGVDACWLGASDISAEEDWVWVTDEPWIYSNWGGVEPNGGINENCLNYYGEYTKGRWNDSKPTEEFSFICEWESEDIDDVKSTYGYLTSTVLIYNNAFYYDGNIYKVFEYNISYEEAKAYCEKLGGHLATITSAAEDKALFSYVSKIGNYDCVIGASDSNSEGFWEWSNGEIFLYTNWNNGEPNNQNEEDYLQYRGSGKWNDTDWKNCFLCEWDDRCILADGTITEHFWGDIQVSKEPTCVTKGEIKQVCKGCSKEITEYTSIVAHSLGEWETITEATCCDKGLQVQRCSVCAYSKEQLIDALEHEWGEWKTKTEATCSEQGVQVQICSSCGESNEQLIDVLEHEWGEWFTVTAATCYAGGIEEKVCTLCNSREQQAVNQLSHNYGEYVVIGGNELLPPIVKEKTCSLCGDVRIYKDWSNVWILIIVLVAVVCVSVGIVKVVKGKKNSN